MRKQVQTVRTAELTVNLVFVKFKVKYTKKTKALPKKGK